MAENGTSLTSGDLTCARLAIATLGHSGWSIEKLGAASRVARVLACVRLGVSDAAPYNLTPIFDHFPVPAAVTVLHDPKFDAGVIDRHGPPADRFG
jgi:hypothetical protein